jgi:hypothetical protein
MTTNSLKRFLTAGNDDFPDPAAGLLAGDERLPRMVAAGVGK